MWKKNSIGNVIYYYSGFHDICQKKFFSNNVNYFDSENRKLESDCTEVFF